jgi:hypothetical protein
MTVIKQWNPITSQWEPIVVGKQGPVGPQGPAGAPQTPAATVEDETTFGLTPAVGTSTDYARADHTHGSQPREVPDPSTLTSDDLLTVAGGVYVATDSPTVDLLGFDVAAAETVTTGELAWSDSDGTLNLGMKGSNVTQQIGLQQYIRAKHASNAGISKGVVYYLSGSTGGVKQVLSAQANSPTTCKTTIGVATETVSGGGQAFITTFGLVRGLPDAQFVNVTEGTVVYLSAATAGAFTSTPPAAPNHRVVVGFCVRKQANNNELFVSVQTGLDVDELCDVALSSPTAGEVLAYDGSVWVNRADRMPTGGTTGQVLAKTSASDYASGWSDPSLVGGAARPLLTGGAYLDGTGLVLSGLGNNWASTPDSAALDVTGDIDIRIRMRPAVGWNVGSSISVSKSLAYQLIHSFNIINGDVRLSWRQSGVTLAASSTVAASANLGTAPSDAWIRGTLDVDNGAGGRTIEFFTSLDGVTWTQLGTTVTQANVASIDNSANEVRIGENTGFGGLLGTGNVYRAQILNGIGGTVAFDADFSTQTADALAFTESSTNAATVTINTTRYSLGLPNVPIISGNATNTAAANGDGYAPFFVTEDIVVDMYTYEVTTGPASTTTLYLGIYQADENLQPTGTPIGTATSTIAASFTGAVYQQITPVTLTPGWYLLAYNPSANLVTRAWRAAYPAILHTMGATSMLSGFNRGRTAATMPSNPSPWNTRFASSNGFALQFLLRWRPA